MTMTREQYEDQKRQIETDPRYPAPLKAWMLDTLREMYEGQGEPGPADGERGER